MSDLNEQRIDDVLSFIYDNLSREEFAEFQVALESDSTLLRDVLLCAYEDAVIAEWARQRAHAAELQGGSLAILVNGSWSLSAVTWAASGLTLAACLLLAVTLWPSDRRADKIGRIVREIDCVWEGGVTRNKLDEQLSAGSRLKLADGLAEFELQSGVRVTLLGPSEVELLDPMKLKLILGRLTAVAPDGVSNFKVHSDSAEVTDLGTSFGVEVDDTGTTQVHVFDGFVDMRPGLTDESATQRISEDQAAEVDATRTRISRINFLPERFLPQGDPKNLVARDDFRGDSIDAATWRTLSPTRLSRLDTSENGLVMAGRGHLVSRQQFDPLACGGIRVTGVLRFEKFGPYRHQFELIQVFTRSNGKPNPDRYFESESGIRFFIHSGHIRPEIHASGPHLRIGNVASRGRLAIELGDAIKFEIVDDGTNVSIVLTDIEDPTNTAFATATVVEDTSETNHVVIYNREIAPGPTGYDTQSLLEWMEIYVGNQKADNVDPPPKKAI